MTDKNVEGLDVLFKFLIQNPDLCWEELRSRMAEEIRIIRKEKNATLPEIIKETKLTASQIKAAEDGSEAAELLTYLKLYQFYKH